MPGMMLEEHGNDVVNRQVGRERGELRHFYLSVYLLSLLVDRHHLPSLFACIPLSGHHVSSFPLVREGSENVTQMVEKREK